MVRVCARKCALSSQFILFIPEVQELCAHLFASSCFSGFLYKRCDSVATCCSCSLHYTWGGRGAGDAGRSLGGAGRPLAHSPAGRHGAGRPLARSPAGLGWRRASRAPRRPSARSGAGHLTHSPAGLAPLRRASPAGLGRRSGGTDTARAAAPFSPLPPPWLP